MTSFKRYLEIVQEEHEIIDESSKALSGLMGILMLSPIFSASSKELRNSIAKNISQQPEIVRELEKKEQENYNKLQARINEIISNRIEQKKEILKRIKTELDSIDEKDYSGSHYKFNELINEFEKEFIFDFKGKNVKFDVPTSRRIKEFKSELERQERMLQNN